MDEIDYTIGGDALLNMLAEESRQRQALLQNPNNMPINEPDYVPGAKISPPPVKDLNMSQQQYQNMQRAYTAIAPNSFEEQKNQQPGMVSKAIGTTLQTATWLLSPLAAPSAFVLAPFAHDYKSETVLGKHVESFSVAGEAAFKRLFPVWGKPDEDYGQQIINRIMPQAPESIKTFLGMSLDVITDPAVVYGGFFHKTVQMGTQITRAQIRAGLIPSEGIVTSGVKQMFLMGAIDDPVEKTGIFSLARQVDSGDLNAAKELSTLFNKEEYAALATKIEEITKKQNNVKMADAFGLTEKTLVDKKIDELTVTAITDKVKAAVNATAEELKAQGIPKNEIDQALRIVKEDATAVIAKEGLSVKEKDLIKLRARQSVALQLEEKYGDFLIDVADISKRSGEEVRKLISSGQITETVKLNKPLTSADNINEVTAALMGRFQNIWQTASRGNRSWSETAAAAQKVKYEKITGRKVGEAWNAETLFASLQTQSVLANEAARLAEAVRITGDPIYKVAHWQALTMFEKVSSNLQGAVSEAGRSLQILQAGPEVFNTVSIKAAEEAVQIAAKMTDFGIDHMSALHANLLKTTEKSGTGLRFLDRFPKGLKGIEDAIYESYLNGLLSAVTTSVKNVTSNSVMTAMQPFEQLMRVPYGGGMEAIQESNVLMQAMARGGKDALWFMTDLLSQTKYGGKVLPTQVKEAAKWRMLRIAKEYPAHYLDPEGVAQATKKYTHELDQVLKGKNFTSVNFGFKPEGLMGKGIDKTGAFIRIPGKALRLQDIGFKFMGYRMGVHQNAFRKALRGAGKDKKMFQDIYLNVLENPAEEVAAAGLQMANYITFQSQLGELGNNAQRLAQARYLRWFFPFIRTNINLMKRGAERSPLGFVNSLYKAFKGNPKAAQEAAARATLGTIVMGTVASTIDSDNIVGHYDLRSPYGRQMMALGIPQYSIKIAGKWISYEGLDFLKTTLGMVANYKRIAASLDFEDPDEISMMDEITLGVTSAIGKFVFDPGWASEMGHLLYLYDSIVSGDPDLMDMATTVSGKTIAMAIPYSRLLAQFNRSYVDEEARMATTILERVMANIPGLSHKLPSYKDLWGDPLIPNEAVGPDIIHDTYNFISPFKIRTQPTDYVRQQIFENPVKFPSMIRDIMGVTLTKTERAQIQEWTGKGVGGSPNLYTAMENMMKLPLYQNALPPARAEMIQNLYSSFREQAKAYLVNDSRLNDNSPESLYNLIRKKQEWRQQQFTPQPSGLNVQP